MRKIFTFLLLTLVAAVTVQGKTLTPNRSASLDLGSAVKSNRFNPPTGWSQSGNSNYSYSYSSYGGYMSTNELQSADPHYMITPALKGGSSIKLVVAPYNTYSSNITQKKNLLSLTVMTDNGDGTFSPAETPLWKFEQTTDTPRGQSTYTIENIPDGVRLGFRMCYYYMYEFSFSPKDWSILGEPRDGLTVVDHGAVSDFATENVMSTKDGKVTFSGKVQIQNTGEYDYTEGDPEFAFNVGDFNGKDAPFQTAVIPMTGSLKVGETKEYPFSVTFDLEEWAGRCGATFNNEGYIRQRIDVKEMASNTTGMVYNQASSPATWYKFYANRPGYQITEVGGYSDVSAINFGYVHNTPVTKGIDLKSKGAAPFKVTGLTMPENVTCDVTEFPIEMSDMNGDKAVQTFNFTVNNEIPGIIDGDIEIKIEGKEEPLKVHVDAIMVSKDAFFEDFEGYNDLRDSDYLFINSEGGSYSYQMWYLTNMSTSVTNSSANKKGIQHTQEYPNNNKIIIGRTSAKEGDKLSFQAAYYSNGRNGGLEVMLSTDRVNWTPLWKAVSRPENHEEGTYNDALNGSLTTYTVDLPVGEHYIAFDGANTYLDNITCPKLVPEEYNVMGTATKMAKEATENTPYVATLTVKNQAKAPAAGEETPAGITVAENSYSVTLVLDGKEVVAAADELPALAPQQEQTYTLSFRPHVTGTHTLQMVWKLNDVVTGSKVMTVEINPEDGAAMYVLGDSGSLTFDTTGSSPSMPIATTTNLSLTQLVYTAEEVAAAGITPGSKIKGASMLGYCKEGKSKLKARLSMLTGDNLRTAKDAHIDMTGATVVFSHFDEESYNIPKCGSKTEPLYIFEMPFESEFTYNGGDLVLQYEFECKEFAHKDYQVFIATAPAPATTGYAVRDHSFRNDASITNMEYKYDVAYRPVIGLQYSKTPASVAGTVTSKSGEAQEGKNLVVTSANGEVIYRATSDAEGKYSVNVFQPEQAYTVTIDDEVNAIYTSDAINFTGFGDAKTLDIVLPEFAKSRDFTLSVKINHPDAGTFFEDGSFTLHSDLFNEEYPAADSKFDDEGKATINVYGGHHILTVNYPGMKPASVEFDLNKDKAVELTLEEDMNVPANLTATVDHDVYTGRNDIVVTWNQPQVQPERIAAKSPANPNESFIISVNGTDVAISQGYEYTVENAADGDYTIAVRAKYLGGETEAATTTVAVSNAGMAKAVFNITTNTDEPVDGYELKVGSYTTEIKDSKVVFESLPAGKYDVSLEVAGFDAYNQPLDLTAAGATVDVRLIESLTAPQGLEFTLAENPETQTFSADLTWNKDVETRAKTYTVSVDGKNVAEDLTAPTYTLTDLKPESKYTVAVTANYQSGASEAATIIIETGKSGIGSMGITASAIRGGQGCIVVDTPVDARIVIADMAGRVMVDTIARAGRTAYDLASGVYAAILNGTSAKVVVR